MFETKLLKSQAEHKTSSFQEVRLFFIFAAHLFTFVKINLQHLLRH